MDAILKGYFVRTLTILGSTGSIGTQTLDILDRFPEEFQLNFLTAHTRIADLEAQALRYQPKGVAISNEACWKEFKKNTKFTGEILCGEEGIIAAAADASNDIVMQALVGFSGVMPTLAAIQAGTSIALANKETLVSAGSIVMKAAKDKNVPILAVDSEHSAILQCLSGETQNSIEKLILTASGGPFRTLPHDEFSTITVEKALKHPNWVMGSKITIDSSTLMNKGFEVIEAHYLFDISIEHIEVIIHPQSIIHSMIQFIDGSIKAQLGTPDMRIPIMYALFYPEHKPADLPRLDLISMGDLSFQKPDIHKFPCLALAYQALSIGGIAPATINAANEIAVQAFLKKHISFNQIPQSIEYTLHKMPIIHQPSISDISHADTEARKIAAEFLHYIAS